MIPPVTCFLSSRLRRRPKGYLWVADPRQVTFFCPAKRKSPKKRPPRSHRPLRGFPVLLARIGARLTRRAQTTRLGLEQRLANYSDSCCDARRRLRGPETSKHPNHSAETTIPLRERCCRPGVFLLWNPPSELAEHRSAPKGFRGAPFSAPRRGFFCPPRVGGAR